MRSADREKRIRDAEISLDSEAHEIIMKYCYFFRQYALDHRETHTAENREIIVMNIQRITSAAEKNSRDLES